MRLSVKRPTETTVLFIVSARPPVSTLTDRLTTSAALILRLLAVTAVILVLANEYAMLFANHALSGVIVKATPEIGAVQLGVLTQTVPRLYRLILVALTLYATAIRSSISESLLVIRGLGVQISTSSPFVLWTSSTRFIPTSSIQDIFIHEAFIGFTVKYYLSIVVEGEENVVVVFPVGH
ncbi:hypothetical protein BAUCODRAFT_175868 [Baudoinia panamericana UAMH 10762]|uniref:Phosphatidylinositol N-acetylglucosaminyltransferase subunit H conserved domain-containing protein n=1 Tax=Baudoinia panamericana (strain UAMH 10762) TaxID=717646 RepID=M2M0S2_BAUPA|nr:uncharacterized protein BAUCODRAFT_175868 [Baudoinia panamericana UAMH 10762]EMD00613.1 hypothetical protein BAUCODRAFT_175868 [Baudoinia panamericana UAMH 10762]